MLMNVVWNEEDFLKIVGDGQQSVYPENPQNVNLKILIPFALGGIIGVLLAVVYLTYWESGVAEVYLSLLVAPSIIGFVTSLALSRKKTKSEVEIGVRGIDRSMLSNAIHFLDMLSQGEADVGKIIDDQKPEELPATANSAFGIALYVLKKIDAEMAKMWLSSLQEKLKPEISFRSLWLIRITIFGAIGLIPVIVVLEIIRMLGLIGIEVAFPLIIGLFGIVLLLVAILSIYAVKSSRDDVPEGVLIAISEPQVRFDTERALEKLIQVIKTEGKYPLRVLVLGEHEELSYTSRVYTTSKGHTLKAAVLIPDRDPRYS